MTNHTVQRGTAFDSIVVEALIATPLAPDHRHALFADMPADNPGDFFLVDLRQQIADRAYKLAEQRGFAAGNELEDWLQAEREVLAAPPR